MSGKVQGQQHASKWGAGVDAVALHMGVHVAALCVPAAPRPPSPCVHTTPAADPGAPPKVE